MHLTTEELENLYPVPPFHPAIVRGVATYAYEWFSTVPEMDIVYIPIGCGSGVCGTILARNALNLKTKIVGVVAENAAAAKLSVQSNNLVSTESANTFADGMAVRIPVAEAFDIYAKGAERIVSVSDDEIAQAIRFIFADTHNVAEGSGAAGLAAALKEKSSLSGKSVGVVLSGGNIDTAMFGHILAGQTPLIA